MDPALRLLSRLQTRAALRRIWRGMRTPKGAAFVVVGLLVLILWFVPLIINATLGRQSDIENTRLFGPFVMLFMCLVTLFGGTGDRVISFTPGEVNFLFPGPFTRRQLLLYKLAKTSAGGLFAGLVFSLVLLPHASNWPSALVAAVLAVLFVQLLTLAVVMVAQSAAARAYSWGRRIVLALVVVLIIAAIAPTIVQFAQEGTVGGGFLEAARQVRSSLPIRVLFAPFEPFVRAFTARTPMELLLWTGVAAAIDAALVFSILKLDADYRDAALAASQKWAQRLQRVHKGQLVAHATRVSTSRWSRVRMLPYLGGAGPIIWRQLTALLRSAKSVLLILLLMAVGLIPLLITPKAGIAPVAITALWGTMLLTIVLRFDFRVDLDQMQWLKALPLSATATAAGQLAVPTLVTTAAQGLLFGLAAPLIPQPEQRMVALGLLPFLLPFNLLLLSVENLLFLLFPSRQAGAAPGDIGLMGRQIVFFLLKTLIVAVACGIAAGAGVGIGILAGKSFVIGGIVTLVILTAIAVAMVPCVGWAYRSFDPSADTPP